MTNKTDLIIPTEYEPLKKITMKTCVGSVRTIMKGQKDPHKPFFVLRVIGVINGTRTGETTFGQYVNFIGSFRAITPDGKGYSSFRCLLPAFLEEQLAHAFMQTGETVRFGFDIIVKPDSKEQLDPTNDDAKPTAQGYEYTANPLMEATADIDAFVAELAASKVDTRLLPAPKKS